MNVSKMMKCGLAMAGGAAVLSTLADHISKRGSITIKDVIPPAMATMQSDGFLRVLWEFPLSNHIVGYSVRLDTNSLVRHIHCRYPELVLLSPACAAGCVCVEQVREVTVTAHYDNGTTAEICKRLDEADEPEQPATPEKGSE